MFNLADNAFVITSFLAHILILKWIYKVAIKVARVFNLISLLNIRIEI